MRPLAHGVEPGIVIQWEGSSPSWALPIIVGVREMTILKNCPFCNGEADVSEGYQNTSPKTIMHYVECINCAASAGWHAFKLAAIEAWNKRADNSRGKNE